jgi:transcriptional regulator with XRE-family HTH domain
MTYGELIRQKREAKGMAMIDVARLLDMAPTMYSTIEKGQRPLNVQTLERIATVLEVPMQELIPSLAGKYHINQNVDGDAYKSNHVKIQDTNFENERIALKQTIAAQQETIEALKLALSALKP